MVCLDNSSDEYSDDSSTEGAVHVPKPRAGYVIDYSISAYFSIVFILVRSHIVSYHTVASF